MRRINLESIKVSMYRDIYHQECSKATSLITILTTDKYKDLILRIRQLVREGKPYKKAKESLPVYTPQGVFNDPLRDQKLNIPSGLVCMDFDELEHFDLEAQKIELSKLPFLVYAGLSCSGTGLFALIAIQNPHKYHQHWRYLYQKFKELGLKPDKSTKNLNRLRFVSYDPNPIINYSPLCCPFFHEQKPKNMRKSRPKAPILTQNSSKNDTIERLETGIRTICSNRIDITQDYYDWLKLGFGLAELGEQGREYFHQLSQFHPEYDPTHADKQFDACLRNRNGTIGLGSVLWMIENVLQA